MKKPIEAMEYYVVKKPVCPHCNSLHTIHISAPVTRTRYQCNACKRTFYLSPSAKCIGDAKTLDVKTIRVRRIKFLVEQWKKKQKKSGEDEEKEHSEVE